MDDHSAAQSFHNHHQLPFFHLASPSLQTPAVGYSSSKHTLNPLEQYGSREEEPKTSFMISNTSLNGRRRSDEGDRCLLNARSIGLDGHANLGNHFDGDSIRGSHFGDNLYGVSKKEDTWEDGESCESASNYFYGKGGHTTEDSYSLTFGSKVNKANYDSNIDASYEAKHETVYSRDASASYFNKQPTSYIKTESGSFSDGCVNYCRTDSGVSDSYLGIEEEYGSSCGSGEDQQQPAEEEGPWPSASPLSQTEESKWRGSVDSSSGRQSQKSTIGISSGVHTQKLDSFSEAFLSQRKMRFPLIPSGDSSQQAWDFGESRSERHSCAIDSYQPPSSSLSPTYPSLPSFPSPPTSSQLMPSVLSPPPTPLPSSSHSPSKNDFPLTVGGYGHSLSLEGEPVSELQFFTPHTQCFPSVHKSGNVWKFPLLSNCFSISSGNTGHMDGAQRPSHGRKYSNIKVFPASHNIVQSPESSTNKPSFHPIRAPCPSNKASLHSSLHPVSFSSHLTTPHYETTEKRTLHKLTQKNGPASLNQSQHQASQSYTGTPFPSILHSTRGQKRSCYTPRPLLNPERRGKGLYCSLVSFHHRKKTASGEENECNVFPHVNVGKDFQAEFPPCFVDGEGSEVSSPEEEFPREQLLWKPWCELEQSSDKQNQVERLLSMCSSSCLPGGGSNTELALHCLHNCKGNIEATLEMLMFSQPSPTGDYHYSGSDLWSDSEKSIFSAALETYGKDFALIQKLVRTKTTSQCVEFYYLSKKLLDKQKKQREEEKSREGELEQQKCITPICQPVDGPFGVEEVVPVPSLASFFPCKLCGKMFYKIKSRNAHMKIHRQPQEDWSDRRLQQQILTQRLALVRPSHLIPCSGSDHLYPQATTVAFSSTGLPGTSNSSNNASNVLSSVTHNNGITPSNASVLDPSTAVTYSNISATNSHVITNTHSSDSSQGESASALPFHQSWGSFEHGITYYYNVDGKDDVVTGRVEGKEPISWQ